MKRKLKHSCLRRGGLVIATLILWCTMSYAQVPALIRYQGQAVDEQGVPLEGPYDVTFRIYDAATGGTVEWEERHEDVALRGGHFSVLLGSVTPLDGMDWDEPCWLAVQVNGEHELEPRQRITSVPTAIAAERLADSHTISPENLLKNGSFESWDPEGKNYANFSHWFTYGQNYGLTKRGEEVARFGATSAKLTYDGGGHFGNVSQMVDDFAPLRGQPVTFSVWVYAPQPGEMHVDIGIEDGVTGTTRYRLPLTSVTWERFTLTHLVSPQATRLEVWISRAAEANPSREYAIYIDGTMLVAGPMAFAFSPHPQDGLGTITTNGINVGIGVPNPTNILTIPQGSPTDPIADSWLVYPSDQAHKELLRPITSTAHLERIKTLPVYEWRRKPLVTEEELPDTTEKPAPGATPAQPSGRAAAKASLMATASQREMVRRRLVDAKAKLPKYTAKRVGIVIDDPNVPPEILTFNADGTIAGIDLLAYAGYLQVALKEAAIKIDQLESRISALEQHPKPSASPPPREGKR